LSERAPTTAFLCLLAGGCAIAFAPIFVRLSDTGPVSSAFWRVALASPLLWIGLGLEARGRRLEEIVSPHASRLPPPAIIFAGIFFALDLGVWHWSIIWTSVANSTLLANLASIYVTLMSWLLWKLKPSRLFLAGMVAAIAGMFILVGPNFFAGGTRFVGDVLAALTAVFYGSYMLTIKVARDAKASTMRIMAWSTTITAIALLPFAWFSPQPFWPSSGEGWLVVLGLALVTQILGQGLIAYAFAHLPASLSSVSLLIQPVMAALFAWMLFGEAIGAAQFVGGAIVLTGIWIARKGS
jgi:drug/metabolite transporter (DMT)-like permease